MPHEVIEISVAASLRRLLKQEDPLADHPERKRCDRVAERLLEIIEAGADKDSNTAIRQLMNYIDGPPRAAVDVNHEGGLHSSVVFLRGDTAQAEPPELPDDLKGALDGPGEDGPAEEGGSSA